jgi:L-lactate dehydrogenase (cytochrome)
MVARLDRAREAGAKGIIVTLDWVFATARDWGSPALPERVDLKTAVRFAPQVVTKPGWLLRFTRSGKLPDLTTPNLVPRGQQGPTFFGAYGEWMGTPPVTWDDLAWLRQQWDGPFLIKGIGRPDDAKRAVDIGATALSVSNHGGNNLDTTPAAIRMLPSVVQAVGGQVEILLDGGVRRGSDVVKALALGANAVMIGRPYLWGMAAAGDRGVHNVLEVIRQGIDSALYGLGHSSIHDLTPDDVIVPDGFTRGM